MKRLFYIITLLIIIPSNILFSKENKNNITNKYAYNNKKLFNNEYIYKKYSSHYIYYRPYNLIEPFRDIRLNIKKNNFTLFFAPYSTDFSSRRITTGGIKYNIYKGIEIYYLAYQKPGKPILYGIENNIGISLSKNIFR